MTTEFHFFGYNRLKKLLAIALSFVLFFVSTALAEPFTFPNGVQWGMSKEKVIELEKREADGSDEFPDRKGLEYIYFESQRVSKYTADRGYLFADDSLFSVWYECFSSNSDSDLKYLQGALSSVYGDSSPLEQDTVVTFLKNIEDSDDYIVSDCVQWVAEGTNIWLFMSNADTRYSDMMLFYIDSSFDPSQIGVYDTTGL